MMEFKRGASFLFAILLAATALAQSDKEKSDAAKVDPAEWAPADALIYVGVTDVDQVWKDFQKTSAYALMEDPSAKENQQLGMVVKGVSKFKERLCEALGVSADQLKNPFKGAVSLFVTAESASGPASFQPGLVAGVGDAAVMKQYYEKVVGRLKETVEKHETVSAGDQQIDVFTRGELKEDKPEDDDEEQFTGPGDIQRILMDPAAQEKAIAKFLDRLFSKHSLPETLATCLTGDRLIVSSSADHVKAILRREKSGKSLADSEDHKDLLRNLKPIGQIRMLVNLPRILELVKADASSDSDKATELKNALKTIGAEGLRSLVGHVRVGGQSFDLKSDVLFLMKGERSGLAKVLSMPNRPTAPPGHIGGDTMMYFGANLNVGKLVDDIESMIRQSDPAAADQMRQGMENAPIGPNQTLNIRKEFIDHLKEPLTFGMALVRPYGADSLRMLLTMGVTDREAITRFFGQLAPMLVSRELRGTTIFDPAMGGPGFSIAPTNDRLVAGNTAAVEASLNPSEGQSLADAADFKRAARMVPQESWFLGYMDNRRMTEALLELAKNKSDLEAGGMNVTTMMLLGMVEQVGDEKEMERIRKLLKYQASAIYTIATTNDGVQFTVVQMKPSEKE